MGDQGPSGLAATIETVARAPIETVFMAMLIVTVVRLIALALAGRFSGLVQRVAQITADLSDAIIYAGILVFMVVRPFILQTFWIPTGSMENTLMVKDYLIVNKALYRTRDPELNEIVVFRAPKEALNPGQEEGKTDFIKRCIGLPGQTIEMRSTGNLGEYRLFRDGKPVYEPVRGPLYGAQPISKDGLSWQGYYLGSPIAAAYKLVKLDGLSPEEMDAVKEVVRADAPGYLQLQKDGTVVTGPGMTPVDMIGDKYGISGLGDKLWALPAAPLPKDCYLMCGDNRSFSSDGRFWGITQRWRVIGRADFVFFPLNRAGLASNR